MTRKELEQLPMEEWGVMPLVDSIYVIADRSKHDSGYKHLNIYGISYDEQGKIVYAKKLSNCSDVIDIKVVDNTNYDDLHIDYLECNVMHIFTRRTKIKCDLPLSSFRITIV